MFGNVPRGVLSSCLLDCLFLFRRPYGYLSFLGSSPAGHLSVAPFLLARVAQNHFSTSPLGLLTESDQGVPLKTPILIGKRKKCAPIQSALA